MDRRANKQTKTCEWEKTNIIGVFTKYGQPVPQPDPTRRVGIAYCLLWRRRHPSHDSGAVFLHLLSMCFPIGWSRELDETDWRLYVSPNWITIDLGDGFVTVRATPLTQPILIYNWLDPEEQFLMRFQRNSNISFGENALRNVVCKCCPFCHGPNALNLELTSPEWMGKFDWGVWYVIIFLYVQFWIRLAAVNKRGKKVRIVVFPAVRSVNKSRNTRNCVQNKPE